VDVKRSYDPGEGLSAMPEFGMMLKLDADYDQIRYYGNGPLECYCDRSEGAKLGVWQTTAKGNMTPYLRPQECGSRCGVRWIDVENEDMILHIDGKSFAFTVSHFDIHQVGQVPHYKDLIKTDKTFIYCDYRMSGVGSNSCGGEPPREEYRINPGEEFEFCVTIAPQKK
jgi:beta-galactosidase